MCSRISGVAREDARARATYFTPYGKVRAGSSEEQEIQPYEEAQRVYCGQFRRLPRSPPRMCVRYPAE